MKKFSFLGVIAVVTLAIGCKPDLVITDFQQNGAATINGDNSAVVPVRVTVTNQGNSSAGIFKVATDYSYTGGTFAVAFTVPGEDIWYPFTDGPLAAGASVTFSGVLTFHPSVHGETVTIKATTDSCSAEEFTPDYCRVNEKNETNNESTSITVALP